MMRVAATETRSCNFRRLLAATSLPHRRGWVWRSARGGPGPAGPAGPDEVPEAGECGTLSPAARPLPPEEPHPNHIVPVPQVSLSDSRDADGSARGRYIVVVQLATVLTPEDT